MLPAATVSMCERGVGVCIGGGYVKTSLYDLKSETFKWEVLFVACATTSWQTSSIKYS